MMNLLYKRWTDKQKNRYKEVLCLQERNDNFRGIRGMGNLIDNNIVANKENGECLIEIYVT